LKSPVVEIKFLQTLSTCVLALSSVVGAASFSNALKKTDGSDPHIVYYSLGLLTWNGSGVPSLERSWSKSGPYLTGADGNYGPGHNG
jgi:hypothetical protein